MSDEQYVTDIEWVVVAESTGAIMARMIMAQLEEEGIPVVITGSAFTTVKFYETPDTKIRVPKRFLDRAKEIVEDMTSATEEGYFCDACGAEVSEDDTVCPSCGEVFVPDEVFGYPEDDDDPDIDEDYDEEGEEE